MGRAWVVAVAAVLVVATVGCETLGVKTEEKAGTVEIRVPVTEKKPEPPKPKTPEVPKPEVPKPTTVKLKKGIGIDITKFFNNDAFTDEDGRSDTTFDQWNQSFPAEELPKAGNLCPPELACCFVFPSKEAKKNNNVACAGQTIPLAGKAKALHLLATATDGNQEEQVTVTYADGETKKDLKVTDWCLEAAFGEQVAAESKSRVAVDNAGQGILSKEEKACRIWCVSIPLDAKRELRSVKLPYNAQIHIFALTLMP